MVKVNVREATTKDVNMLMDLWVEFTDLHDKIVLKKNPNIKPHIALQQNAQALFRKFVRKQIRSNEGFLAIAEVDGKPAGYVLCSIKENVPVYYIEKLGYIVDMYVKKEFQGLGISTKLKDESIAWFKKKKIEYVSLLAFYDNSHARKVYEKWGFLNLNVEMRFKIR